MENNIKSNTTFWTEINNYKIQVPYYQRDYAQGRTDGGRIDNIREVFVEELYQAIRGEKKCHLGLVFGSYDIDNSTFIAVDGQQRLTTVFLLYWYVAWRENKLDDYHNLSTNFSWDTRSYSSQFVELLFKIKRKGKVVDDIKANCNYFSIWENDPTVKGMLTMLEEIEKQYPKDECGLCQKLFSDDSSIKYDILKLEKNSDGKTYLKMNSRGRSLTTFELFKSKFIDECKPIDEYKPSIANKFDDNWLTFMLEMSKDDNRKFADPDISYMNFINEYTYMILSLHSNDDSDKEYKHFIDAKMKDNLTDVPFISFEKYKPAFENINSFEKFFDWICPNYETIKSIDEELRFPDSKFFADEIIKSSNPHFSHRTKLFSLYKYAELTEYAPIDKELYKRWNRVFRNLVANSEIDGNNFGKICKTINQVANADIYLDLANEGKLNTFDKGQIEEEIAKAKQILNGEQRSDGKTWEEIIIEAEKYAFFKGAIRFLFTDGEGKVTEDSWKLFDNKWVNAKEYFNGDGVCQKYVEGCVLLRTLISYFSKWENFTAPFYVNSKENWRDYILLNKDLNAQVNRLLSNNIMCDFENFESDIDDARMRKTQDQLVKTTILDYLNGEWYYLEKNNVRLHIWHTNHSNDIYLGDNVHENEILVSLIDENRIGCGQRIKNTTFFRGENIKFQYNQHCFIYYSNNTVCLMNDNWEGKKLKNSQEPDTPENNYYFPVDKEENKDTFLTKLNGLIEEANVFCANCQTKQCEKSE
ncbi:MAG: DUF262 domain-containing protein [Salinivirgaceae bacterium]|nr:DUF262 domain-containing protein [Salinivirgaceae bacterium]